MLDQLFDDFVRSRRLELIETSDNLQAAGFRLSAFYEKNISPEVMRIEKKVNESCCYVIGSNSAYRLTISITYACLGDYLTLLLHDDHFFTNMGVRKQFEGYLGKLIAPTTMVRCEFDCDEEGIQAVLDCFYPC
ncbi:hypothetical protein HYX12_03840 [Candidatus Woesearchaeota archaeon]|nr:hypothetical protein [Candidatus Woesearchaeota archaeon]